LVPGEVADLLVRDYGADIIVADRLTKVAEYIGVAVDRHEFERESRAEGTIRPRWRGPAVGTPGYRATPTPRVNFTWSAHNAAFRPVWYHIYRGVSPTSLAVVSTVAVDAERLLVDTTISAETVYYYGVSYTNNRGYMSDITVSDAVTTGAF